MVKLGKKARKFAKKNLQSVLKRNRHLKSIYKRRHTSRDKQDTAEDQVRDTTDLSNGRNSEGEAIGDSSLGAIFSDDESDSIREASDSDGFLSEESSCEYFAESGSKNDSKDKSSSSALLGHNREIYMELAKQKRKLDRLKEKDPEFSKFLERHNKDLEQFRNEEIDTDEEDDTSNQGMRAANEDDSNLDESKVLTSSTIASWCQLVMEQHSMSVLPNLLNGYRAACRYGIDGLDAVLCRRIQKSESFCNLLTFMLREADNIFRRLLDISSSSFRKETILEMKNSSKWKSVKPLVKSYLRSTLFLLNQVTDTEILVFTLTRIRASIIFFADFPSLLQNFIKITVHLWATGGGTLSSSAFLFIKDVAFLTSSDCFGTCLIKSYKAFIAHCKFVDPANLKHIQFLGNSLVELCSLDVQKSSSKALVSIQCLGKILQQALKTKKKEALKRIYNWQYINCMDLWVKFITANIGDHDLGPLLYLMIQVIRGVAHLFPGPRFLPLRVKCIQMLNHLSCSGEVFVPITSLVLHSLGYSGSGKADARPGKAFDFSSILKVPKHWLKSRDFQEECVFSAIELLSVHFAQWSYNISFPELATIPLAHLRKFHAKITTESLRRVVIRLIDQVEQNVDFVQKKRDNVTFSPKDLESMKSFLQLEKSSGNAPFTQYYTSIMQKSALRHALMKKKRSVLEMKETGNRKIAEGALEKEKVNLSLHGRRDGRKRKKQRT